MRAAIAGNHRSHTNLSGQRSPEDRDHTRRLWRAFHECTLFFLLSPIFSRVIFLSYDLSSALTTKDKPRPIRWISMVCIAHTFRLVGLFVLVGSEIYCARFAGQWNLNSRSSSSYVQTSLLCFTVPCVGDTSVVRKRMGVVTCFDIEKITVYTKSKLDTSLEKRKANSWRKDSIFRFF